MNHSANAICNNLPEIQALLPIYTEDGGNSTEVCLVNGKRLISPKKTKTILKNIAESYTKDVSLIRRKYGSLIGRKHQAPLPLIPDLILVPLKFRSPIGKDEGALCYISQTQVASWKACGKTSTKIIFKNELEIEVMQSIDSVTLALKQADMIRMEYIKNLDLKSIQNLL
ncbi:ComK protein [Desulfonispora thiosulfatigenes DSM 11270]|uniref:ComK protein n=1 Tax=Desulfonispora thiosulfatigenes DSM 11270 TaxID=656914 RepID=A0A1W1V5X7_DESTI|nr:competence protein ComK [Desulfonispora thiosulfatigenes]SMB88580.1 ComK protein [Desulfonispora thiosulfatigenes DSM 11270]